MFSSGARYIEVRGSEMGEAIQRNNIGYQNGISFQALEAPDSGEKDSRSAPPLFQVLGDGNIPDGMQIL